MTANLTPAGKAVITVGAGRGFVMGTTNIFRERVIVTAAHCLPQLPPPNAMAFTEERTYPDLLGPLHDSSNVSAECLFVDPVADIAILGGADNQTFPDQATSHRSGFCRAQTHNHAGDGTMDWLANGIKPQLPKVRRGQ